jgi:hypothetical protein
LTVGVRDEAQKENDHRNTEPGVTLGRFSAWRLVLLDLRYFGSVAFRALRDWRGLVLERDVWRDWWRFRRSARGVLDALSPGGNTRGDILIVSLSGMIYSTKLEGVLAKALQLRGYDPVVLTSRYAFWARRYFSLYGVRRFIFVEDFSATPTEIEVARKRCEEFMSGPVDLPTCKAWNFEGASVGQYAVSTVARSLHRGMPDFRDPKVRAMLGDQLLHCILGIFRAKRIFAGLHPEICLFNEINYSDYGPVYAVAYQQGLNVIQFVHALRDSALIFKRSVPETYRIHPNSISRSEMNRLSTLPWGTKHEEMLQGEFRGRYGGNSFIVRRDQAGKQMKDREAVYSQLGLDRRKKVAVVFSHILWDANLFYGDDLFDDNEHWFIETLRAACRNDRVNWLIRLHPAIGWKRELDNDMSELNELVAIRKHVGTLPAHVKLLMPDNDINSYSIFEIADYGVTIRGTVGIELPCFGVPVLTAGTGRYSGLGFTVDSATRNEYINRLLKIHEIPMLNDAQTLLAKKHALAVFCLRPWVMKAFGNAYDTEIKGFHPLNPSVFLRATKFEDLDGSDDLRKFAEWAADRRSYDYLEKWPLAEEVSADSGAVGTM